MSEIVKKFALSLFLFTEADEPQEVVYPFDLMDTFRVDTVVDLSRCPILAEYCKEWERESDSLEWLSVQEVATRLYELDGQLVSMTVAHLTRDSHCQNCGFPIS